MKKDKSIISLVNRVKQKFHPNFIEIIDYWDADLCSIGLRRDERLIYISTFNYLKKKDLRYDFDLELSNNEIEQKVNIIKSGRNVSEEELFSEIKEFFEI